jgi:glycosyltransferase involved in cell wall biosynthesis
MSGVATHVNLLLGSRLAGAFELRHFQVGSEGRSESAPARLLRLAASPFLLAAACLRRGAAIVHINTSLNARGYWRDLAYTAIARLCGARVVWQVHGGCLPRDFFGAFGFFLKTSLRWPAAIVVLAESELRAYRELLPEQAVVAIPNGIDCAPYRGTREARSSGPLRLVYVGRLAAGKGLDEIVEATGSLKKRGVPFRLVIAGGGPEESRLKERIQELNLDHEIEFPGPAYGEDKARLLRRSDLLLLPSYSEGLPYALLEGMAAGVVPIVTPVGAIPDVVVERVHGVFVPVGDSAAIAGALEALAAERATVGRMSDACRKRIVLDYSLERLASAFKDLYTDILFYGKRHHGRLGWLGRRAR